MTQEQFNSILARRLALTEETLARKGREYARGDRLSNFKKVAALFGSMPSVACLWFLSKHLVSISDFIADAANGVERSDAEWEGKIGDAICYLVLLEAIVKEQRIQQ